jgi:hypothetical protein
MDMERVASPAWGGVKIELYRAIGAVAWPAWKAGAFLRPFFVFLIDCN